MKIILGLNHDGELSLLPERNNDMPLMITFNTFAYMGDHIALKVSFSEHEVNSLNLEKIKCKLQCVDNLTDDIIFEFNGNLSLDEKDANALWNILANSGLFFEDSVEVALNSRSGTVVEAIRKNSAFNAFKSYKKNQVTLLCPEDIAPESTQESIIKALENILNVQQRPSDIAIAYADKNLDLLNAVLVANEKLNVPITAELDPMGDPEELLEIVDSLHLNVPLLQILWCPFTHRPLYLESLRGRSKPCSVLGQFMAKTELRNRVISADGIPNLVEAVAGEKYPFDFKDKAQRSDVVLDDAMIERFARSNINLVRMVTYDTGTKLVLSDVRSQYNSKNKNSLLDLFPSSVMIVFITNRCIDILKRYMLSRMESYIKDASQDIEKFLNGCVAMQMLVPANALGGQPYEFKITPSEEKPYERVHFYLARRVDGYVRSVIFDGDVVVN